MAAPGPSLARLRAAAPAILRATVWCGGALHLVLFSIVAARTVGYPYPLEWMEGGTMDVVDRVVEGLALYTEPTLEYVPYVYAPLYYYVCGAVASITGVHLPVGRAVSLLAAIGVSALIGRLVHRETGRLTAGAGAAALFVATFEASGRWFHVARVDSFALLLVIATVYVLRFHPGLRGTLLAGVLAGLAVATKQSSLVALGPVLLITAWSDRRRAAVLAAVVAAWLAALIAADRATGGWLTYFTWKLPLMHPTNREALMGFWLHDVAASVPLGMFAAALGLAPLFRHRDRFHLAVACGLVGAAYAGRLHSGGYVNVLMPMHAAMAILAGAALGTWKGISADPASHRSGPRGFYCRYGRGAALALVASQLLLLLYDPAAAVPTPADHRAQERYLDRLSRIEGEVLVDNQRWLPRRAGQASHGLGMAAMDLLRAEPGDWVAASLRREMREALRQRRFAAIVTGDEPILPDLDRYYRRAGTLLPDGHAFPVTGARLRPHVLHLPRPSSP